MVEQDSLKKTAIVSSEKTAGRAARTAGRAGCDVRLYAGRVLASSTAATHKGRRA